MEMRAGLFYISIPPEIAHTDELGFFPIDPEYDEYRIRGTARGYAFRQSGTNCTE
jgi:hypothetical protein